MIPRCGSARTPLVLTAVTLLVLLALILFVVRGDRAFSQTDAKAVEHVLMEQQNAWNKGDLEGFMSGYHRSKDMTFFAGGDPRRGWDDALERYRQRYQGEGREMGKLTFSDLQIEGAGPDHAWVRGRWFVTFSDGKAANGLFTLILRRFPEGWRIVHDHTSEAEKPLPPPD